MTNQTGDVMSNLTKCDNGKDNNSNNNEYTFDDFYLDSYLATGDKTESYRKAAVATDYPLPKYVQQASYMYHKRINRDGLIDTALRNHAQSDSIQARIELNNLRDTSDSENIRYQVARLQVGDLYSSESTSAGITVNVNRDNVEITHKNQTLKIESKDWWGGASAGWRVRW